jgi:uncharacterized membrane protein YphA (DoxX/SURF4 family)
MENLTPTPWSYLQKLAFQFCFIFLLFNTFPFPLNMYPDEQFMDGLTYTIWNAPVQWIAKNLLHKPDKLSTVVTGSGDTTFNWIVFFLTIALSLFFALIWSFLDRKRPHYSRLNAYLRLYLRYYLAYMLLLYGIIKVFYLQMTPLSLFDLTKTYGSFSPMGVLWRFIGASKAYSIFAGLSEVIGGILLLFRRTTLLGALIAFIVMVNVFVLNMCYDVPVKIFSFFLVFVAVFLANSGVSSLIDFFLRHKTTTPRPEIDLFKHTKWQKPAILLKIAVVAWMFYSNISGGLEGQKEYGEYAPRSPLAGNYDVKKMVKNNVVVTPLLTDSTLWRKFLVVDKWAGWARITMANDSIRNCDFDVDTLKRSISFAIKPDTVRTTFTYFEPTSEELILKGVLKQDSVVLFLKRYDEKKFLLKNRGFHWVNEVPFNR